LNEDTGVSIAIFLSLIHNYENWNILGRAVCKTMSVTIGVSTSVYDITTPTASNLPFKWITYAFEGCHLKDNLLDYVQLPVYNNTCFMVCSKKKNASMTCMAIFSTWAYDSNSTMNYTEPFKIKTKKIICEPLNVLGNVDESMEYVAQH
jgi:hypothetical protein